MINKIKKYPSIIARPYINALKKDAQWKDNQRYAFENLITVMASYAVSDLLKIYVDLRNPADDKDISDNDIEIIESLKNLENLKLIGLEQMSLGKWCAILRETTKVLNNYPKKCFIKELPKLFQPANNKLWQDINTLVKYRNDDAHGVPISDSVLEKTLNKRQEILDRILESCSFLGDYKMSFFDKLILESDSQKVSGWSFVNDGHESLMIDADVEPPMKEILLLDSGNKFYMKLRPLVVYAPIVSQDSKQLSLYSKQLDKDGNSMHYLGVDGAVDIIIDEFDEKHQQTLGERWKYLHEIYSEENILIPNLDGNISVSDSIEVNEENSITLTLDNNKSIDVFSIECNITFPDCFEIILDSDNNENIKLKNSESNTYIISLEELPAEEVKKFEIKFQADIQGSVRIPSPHVDFKYFRTEADEETGNLSDSDAMVNGASIQIYDPKSPDRMIPVINVNRHYLNNNGENINNIEIGKDFIYELLITNIGMGAARDLSVEVVFPENLELVDGVDNLVINLNPSETRSFRYLATTRMPGQYKINLRDLSYKDFDGRKYISSFSDDYSIIVKSNIEKQFEFELTDAISDFTIDDNEKARLNLRKKELSEIYKNNDDYNIEKWFENALFDASIKNIRKLITSTAKKRGFSITEKIIKDTKKQSKLNNGIARKSLIFSIKDIPFFGIDITNTDNIIFHSLDSRIIDGIYDFDYKVLFACGAISGYTLPLSLKYEPMLWSDELDINWFKKWINICITALDKEHLPILKVKKEVEKYLDMKLPYKNGMYFLSLNSDCRCKFESLLERENDLYPQPKKPFSTEQIAFRETGIMGINLINYRGELLLGVEGLKSALPDNEWTKNNIIFLGYSRLGQSNCDLTKRWVDDERVNWYRINSKKPNNFMFVKVKNNNIDDFIKLIDLHKIATSKTYLKSDLFKKQCDTDLIEQNVDKLSSLGFLLRAGTVNLRGGLSSKGMLEVYPHMIGLGKATVHDCVGFLHTLNSQWKLYINFYNFNGYSDYTHNIKNNISISTFFKRNGVQQANRTFFVDNIESCSDKINTFFNLLYKSIEFYGNSNKSVWPNDLCNDMISQFINTDKDIQKREVKVKLLKELLSGPIVENEINKEYKTIVKSCDGFYNKYNTIFPVRNDSGTLFIAQEYRSCIEAISSSNDGLPGLIDDINKDKNSTE